MGDEGRVDEALELLGEMREEGHSPNGMTYNYLILDACHEGCLTQAKEVVVRMEQDGLHPIMEALEAVAMLAKEMGEDEVEMEFRDKMKTLEQSKAELEATSVDSLGPNGIDHKSV